MTRGCEVEECDKPAAKQRYCSMHYARKRRNGSVNAVRVIHGDRLAGFMQKVEQSEGCWEWLASRTPQGYGQFVMKSQDGKRRPTTAQRAAWMLLVGPIPEGKFVDHICHNRGCVNPQHLRLATPKQNNENHSGKAPTTSTTGVRGVHWAKGRYHVLVNHNYKAHHGGIYTNLDAAKQAAINLRNELFTFNDRDRGEASTTNPDLYRSRRRRKKGEAIPCGTTSRYRSGCRCDKCKTATREYKRQVALKKRTTNTNQKAA